MTRLARRVQKIERAPVRVELSQIVTPAKLVPPPSSIIPTMFFYAIDYAGAMVDLSGFVEGSFDAPWLRLTAAPTADPIYDPGGNGIVKVGDAYFAVFASAVNRSTDCKTWTEVLAASEDDEFETPIIRGYSTNVYILKGIFLYKSIDAGVTFSLVTSGAPLGAIDYAVSRLDPATLCAIVKNGNVLEAYVSTDSGATWSDDIDLNNTDDYNCHFIEDAYIVQYTKTGRAIVLGSYIDVSNSDWVTFLSYSDDGIAFTNVEIYRNHATEAFGHIALPTDSKLFLVLQTLVGGTVYMSEDDGLTWIALPTSGIRDDAGQVFNLYYDARTDVLWASWDASSVTGVAAMSAPSVSGTWVSHASRIETAIATTLAHYGVPFYSFVEGH